ncbi:MAG: hypothetical protein RLZZ591_1961, partial [Pseudomonadota bacterium]
SQDAAPGVGLGVWPAAGGRVCRGGGVWTTSALGLFLSPGLLFLAGAGSARLGGNWASPFGPAEPVEPAIASSC